MKIKEFHRREKFIEAAADALKDTLGKSSKTPFAVMLSGGSTPLEIWRYIQNHPFTASKNAHVFYSDERHVGVTDAANNYHQSRGMLKAADIAKERVMRVQTELELEKAASAYNETLASFQEKGGWLPLGILGMGTDGHTASLFSIADTAVGRGLDAFSVRRPEPPDRITVSTELIWKVERVLLLLAGNDKNEIFKVLTENHRSIPAGRVLYDHPGAEVWRLA